MLENKKRIATMELELQNNIDRSPVPKEQMYKQACSKDDITITTWQETWLKNIRDNKTKFGSFRDLSLGRLFKKYHNQSAIIAGSGPSLAYNGHLLKERKGIPLVSALHNFHFMEDNGAEVDLYVTLDAGEVTIEEVSEGGKRSPDEYWALTKNRKLAAFIGTSPRLLEKWQGEIYFYNAPVPSKSYLDKVKEIEPFNVFVSTGGNVLGACLYIAKGYLGCNPIAFLGADFSFSYDKKFHGWDSKYDKKLGYVLKATDIFGNKVLTWQSYFDFATWFNYIAENTPGIYINCTEGGCFGAYPEGNILAVKQMKLTEFLNMQLMCNEIEEQINDPEKEFLKILF